MALKDETKITKEIRERVLTRDAFEDRTCCRVCGSPYCIELHHIITRGAGGKGDERNLISLCHGCHQAFHRGDISVKQRIEEIMLSIYPDWEKEEQRV